MPLGPLPVQPPQTLQPRVTCSTPKSHDRKLVARVETPSREAQSSRNHDGNPTQPHRCRPASNHNRPTHVYAQYMQDCHQSEDRTREQQKCFLTHSCTPASFLQRNG